MKKQKLAKVEPPSQPAKKPAETKTVRGGGFEWVTEQGISKDQWLEVNAKNPEMPARIKRLDAKTFACYRDGKYLGSEATIAEAFDRIKVNAISEKNRVMALWQREHPDELPPGLQLTEAERAEYWRHNPVRGGQFRPSGPLRREPGAKPGGSTKIPSADGGGVRVPGSAADAPARAPVASGGRFKPGAGATITAKPGTVPIGKAGSKWHERQKAVLACVGNTVQYCLAHGGDKDAIKHMTLKGVITLEGE